MGYLVNIEFVLHTVVVVAVCFTIANVTRHTLLHTRARDRYSLLSGLHRDYIVISIVTLAFAITYSFVALVGVSTVSYVYILLAVGPHLVLLWFLTFVHGMVRTVRALYSIAVVVWLGYTYAVTFEYIPHAPAVLEFLANGVYVTMPLMFSILYIRSASGSADHRAAVEAVQPMERRTLRMIAVGLVVWACFVGALEYFGAFNSEAKRADAVLAQVARVINESSGRRIALIQKLVQTYQYQHIDDPQVMLATLEASTQPLVQKGEEVPRVIAILTANTLTYLSRSGNAYTQQSIAYEGRTDPNWIAASLLNAGEVGVASADATMFCVVRGTTSDTQTDADCNEPGQFSVYTPWYRGFEGAWRQDEVLVIMYDTPDYIPYLNGLQVAYPNLFLADPLGHYIFGGTDFIADYPAASAEMLAQAGTSHAVDQGRDIYYRIIRPAFEGVHEGRMVDLDIAKIPARSEFLVLGLTFDTKATTTTLASTASTTKDVTILAPFPVGNPGSKTGYQGAKLALAEAGERAGQYHVTMKLIDATAKDFRNVDDDEANIEKIVPSLADPAVVGVIGTMSSGGMVRMIPYYNNAGLATMGYRTTYAGLTVPDFGGAGEYERLYPSGIHTFFSLTANGEQTARETIWRVLSEEHGRLLLVTDDTVFGKGILRSFERWLARFKYDDYATTTVSLSMKSEERHRAIDAANVASTTHVLYMGFANAHTDDMFGYLSELKYQGKAYAQGFTGLQTDPTTLPETYPIYAVEYAPRPSSFTNKRAQDFVQAYRAMYNAEPTPHAVAAYEGVRLLLGAIAKSDGTREDVLRIIATTRAWPSIFGLVRFDVYGNSPHQTTEILRLKGGKWVHDEFLKHD